MVVLFCSGCASFQQVDRQARYERGLTLVLPGIEGASFLSDNMAYGLQDGGVQTAIEVHDWTSGQPLRSLEHLVSFRHNQQAAERLASRIMAFQDRNPGRPVNLVGHSGGAGVILMAVDLLPSHYRIAEIVLLAPAISRGFETDRLSGKVNQIFLYYSPFDLQLTLGTSLFGSVDRRFGPAAGSLGFRRPAIHVRSIPYHPSMWRSGHPGGHLGCTSYRFVRDHVAPLLLDAGEP